VFLPGLRQREDCRRQVVIEQNVIITERSDARSAADLVAHHTALLAGLVQAQVEPARTVVLTSMYGFGPS